MKCLKNFATPNKGKTFFPCRGTGCGYLKAILCAEQHLHLPACRRLLFECNKGNRRRLHAGNHCSATDKLAVVHSSCLFGAEFYSGQREIAPCKGIHDSPGFWIPPCGFRIPSTGFRIPAQWIPDSKKGWIPNFFLF